MRSPTLALLTLVLGACTAPSAAEPSPTADVVSQQMQAGFNLGNTFDVSQNPTALDQVRQIIDLYADAGMKHVRIPVTWMDGFGGDHLADSDGNLRSTHPRLQQLDQAIDYALRKGLVVMINTHHEHWLKRHYDDSAGFKNRFRTLWTGIANRYKDRSPNLIFEVLNEPEGPFGDWSGAVKPFDPEAIRRTREINQIGYDAIRATGGTNATRVIVLAPNGQGNQSMLDEVYPEAVTLPGGGKDRYLMVSVHTYDPWDFCGQTGSNDKFPGTEAIAEPIRAVAAHGRKLGVPVNYGEFGVGRDGRQAERDTDLVRGYYRTVQQTALAEGMSITPWDDRGWFGLSRLTPQGEAEFVFGIVPAMMRD